MTRPLVRRAAAGALLLPLALSALTACGGDDESSAKDTSSSADVNPFGAASSSAATDTSAAASPSEEATGTTDGPGTPAAGESVEPAEFMKTFKAAFDKATTAHMTMELGGATALSAEGDADYTTDPLSMSMTMTADALGQDPIELILVDGIMYMKIPGMGDKFVKMDLSDPSNPLGSTFSDQLDPRSQFDTFEKGITSATYVGEEDVDGESLQHYTVAVDGTALLEGMDPSLRDLAASSMPETISYDLWFDGDGLYRRMKVDLGAAAGGEMTMSFSDWGEPVSITAPPASQTQQMPGA